MLDARRLNLFRISNARPEEHHARMLAMGVGGLAVSVLTLMMLSLAGCEGFSGGASSRGAGGAGGAGRGAEAGHESRGGSATAAARHVAPAARTLSVNGVSDEPDMRIRVAAGIGEANFSASAGSGVAKSGRGEDTKPVGSVAVYVQPVGGRAGGAAIRLVAPARIIAPAIGASEWIVTDSLGVEQRVTAEMVDVWGGDPPVGAGAGLVTLNGTAYSGHLRLVPRSDAGKGTMDVVEFVPLETYLAGVVVKEMFPNWPIEAFRVQAICARSYALHERVRAGGTKTYDIEASQRAQAYSGATSNRRALDAVASTRGLVLAHQDDVLRAYYSSSCGGRTGAARDTWPTTRGFEYNLALPIQAYVRETTCGQSSPQYSWTVTRNRDELVKRLRAYGETNGMLIRKIEGLASVQVLRAAPTGRPAEYKIVEPGGRWFQLRAEDLRLACNTSATGLPPVTSKERVLSGDLEFVVRPESGGAAGAGTPPTVEIRGRGFGHGVGMCQYCVKSMADRGDDWRTMLMRFYPGADVRRVYR